MSTTVIKSIDVEVRTIENHPKLDWAKIAHFNGVDSQHTKEMAIQWLNRTFKLNQELHHLQRT